MAEVDDNELAELRKAHGLLDKLYRSKDNGMAFKKLMKAEMPEAHIPELDILESVRKPYDDKLSAMEAENKKLREEWDADRKARSDKENETEVRMTLDQVQKKYNLTDDGMAKVVDRMRTKNNPDAESAAAFIVSQQPAPSPSKAPSYLPSDLNLYGVSTQDDVYADLHKDPAKWFDKEV